MRTPLDGRLRVKAVAAGSRQSVFVFEFGEVGTVRRLSEALAKTGGDSAIYAIDPVADIARSPGYVSLIELADQYARFLIDLHKGGPLVVVGHCAASVLAMRVAAVLREDRTVRTVLVQPTRPDLTMIRTEYARIRQNLALDDVDVGAIRDDAESPQELYRRIDQALARGEQAWAEDRGVSGTSPALAYMASRHRAWLSALLSSYAALASSPCPDDALIVESGEPPGDWPDRYGHRHVLASATTGDPLDDAELMKLVLAGRST